MTWAKWRYAIVGLGLVFLLKIALAATWPLLADEAYYWVWADTLAWAYYDQPGAVAWFIAGSTAIFGDAEWAVRLPFIACGALGACFQGWATKRPLFAMVWWSCLPPLAWLTLFATPDAILLTCWAAGLAFAMAGGPWWLLAALAASLATYSKLIGLGLLPLLLLGGWGYEGDRKWRGSALALYLVSLAPLVLWNLEHDWVNIQFQFREGLYHPHPPGGFGMVFQQLDQIGVVTPLTYLAVLIWGARKVWLVRAGEPLGLPWWSSVPVVCFFFICSPFAPSEAHWPAVAYVSAGFGLAQAKGKLRRLMDTGLGLGLAATAVLVSHGLFPWLPLWKDPGTRLTEGLVLADRVAHWAAPEGTSIGHWNGEGAPQIFTERYQEAALITYYTPLVAHKFPGCGRIDYYDKLEVTRSSKALFVRPTTSGYDTCLDDHYASRSSPNRTQGIDDANRLVGQWDIIEYEQPK